MRIYNNRKRKEKGKEKPIGGRRAEKKGLS